MKYDQDKRRFFLKELLQGNASAQQALIQLGGAIEVTLIEQSDTETSILHGSSINVVATEKVEAFLDKLGHRSPSKKVIVSCRINRQEYEDFSKKFEEEY